MDHPLHPLAIAAVHRVLGGDGPVSWQRAAQAASIAGHASCWSSRSTSLALEIFGPSTAWLGCLLVIANPVLGNVVINVLSESTFLLFWTWGLWAAVRFLREGRFVWLPLTIGFAALAYLARPEGMLLPLALVATLLVLPLHWATRIYWPRWWAAVAFLVLGSVLLVGPYMAAKGGIGTQAGDRAADRDGPHAAAHGPGARPPAARRPDDLRDLPPGDPADAPGVPGRGDDAAPAAGRARPGGGAAVVIAGAGSGCSRGSSSRPRRSGLVRLHATGGYCTVRHAVVPAMLLTLAAANGLAWLIRSIVIDGPLARPGRRPVPARPGRLGRGPGRARRSPRTSRPGPRYRGSFASYRDAGSWIAAGEGERPRQGARHDRLVALLQRQAPGSSFSEVYWAAIDPNTRWIVARDAHLRAAGTTAASSRTWSAARQPVVDVPDPIPQAPAVADQDLTTARHHLPLPWPGRRTIGRTSPQVTREARNIRR